MVKPGVRSVIPLMSTMPIWSRSSPLKAVTAIGMLCTLSSLRWEVTIISSMTPAPCSAMTEAGESQRTAVSSAASAIRYLYEYWPMISPC